MPHGDSALAALGCQSGFLRKISFLALILAAAFSAVCQATGEANAAVARPKMLPESIKPGATPVPLTTQWPRVTECLLERPLLSANGTGPGIHIVYPALGNQRVDADIKEWVSDIADAFVGNLDYSSLIYNLTETEELSPSSTETDTLLPNIANFELWGQYQISRPSHQAVSIAFELWNYTGAPEGSLDILTLNYSLLTGQRLNFVDIFEKPDVALKLMSDWSRKTLEPRLGAARRTAMLTGGTEPLVENFSSFTLTPDGICINFQPWQVAPLSAGIQKVLMPLEELMPSAPLLALWGK